ncbi:ureidoglycolate lyase [Marinibaculum pumilum]|uniref:Ureidoglycolate lyase n=1 Tax=Marinibaculum pumilum TaxID=1766165 RepID=A0ABV7KTI9_9PROT
MTETTIQAEPLTAAAFAPFGQVIDPEPATGKRLGFGTTIRFDDLIAFDFGDGRAKLDVYRVQPATGAIPVPFLERHPLSTQLFAALTPAPFLVVVAPPLADADGPDPARIRAFQGRPGQAISYHRGTWHGAILALERETDFIAIDRGGPEPNRDVADIGGVSVLPLR